MKKSTNLTKNSSDRGEGRSRPQHAKMGRKTKKDKLALDKKLHELFDQDGMTPWRASIECECSYEYAVQKFDEFGLILAEAEEENWIERQGKVRKRILEGLSVQIMDSRKIIETEQKRLEKTRDIQESLMDKLVEDVEDTELAKIIKDAIGRMDPKIIFAIFKQITDNLDTYRSYGFLVEKIDRQIRSERVFNAELTQQYAGIEIMPPPTAILKAEIEKSIAAKNDLFQVRGPQPEE